MKHYYRCLWLVSVLCLSSPTVIQDKKSCGMPKGKVMGLSWRWMENCLSIQQLQSSLHVIKSLSTNGYWTSFPKAKLQLLYECSQAGLDHELLLSSIYYLCFHLHCLQRDSCPVPSYFPSYCPRGEPLNEHVGSIPSPSPSPVLIKLP